MFYPLVKRVAIYQRVEYLTCLILDPIVLEPRVHTGQCFQTGHAEALTVFKSSRSIYLGAGAIDSNDFDAVFHVVLPYLLIPLYTGIS